MLYIAEYTINLVDQIKRQIDQPERFGHVIHLCDKFLKSAKKRILVCGLA